MDGQSNTSEDIEVFTLYPVMIQGWVDPVQPRERADGGIPKKIYDEVPEGLECLIDPWTEFRTLRVAPPALNDRVDLYIDGLPTAVAGKTIQPADVDQRITLHVPKNYLVEGVNEIYYKVTRPGGNSQDSRRLKVLYHAKVARVDPPQLPASINKEMAAKGVEVIFNYYNRRPYDRIRLKIGNAVFNRPVELGESNPIKTTLYTETFEAAGDNPKTEVVCEVFDQLDNYSGESAITVTDVNLARLDLKAPILLAPATNPIDLMESTPVIVRVGFDTAQEGDKAQLIESNPLPGSVPFPQLKFNDNNRARFTLSPGFLGARHGTAFELRWQLIRDGKSIGESEPLRLEVKQIVDGDARLPTPAIDGAIDNVLDVKNMRDTDKLSIARWPLQSPAPVPAHRIWLLYEGFDDNGEAPPLRDLEGVPHDTPGLSRRPPFEWLKKLKDGSRLTITFMVSFDGEAIKERAVRFPLCTYTVKSTVEVEDSEPEITSVQDSNGVDIPDGTTTPATTLTLTGRASKDQKVQLYNGTAPIGGEVTAVGESWTTTITVAVGTRRLLAKALYGSGKHSMTWVITVVPELTVDTSNLVLSGQNISIQGTGLDWPLTGNDPDGTAMQRVVSGGVPPYTYTSSDPRIVSIDEEGMARSQENGSATITVKDSSNQTKTYTVTCSNVRRLLYNPTPQTMAQAAAWIVSMKGTMLSDRFLSDYPYTIMNIRYKPGLYVGPLHAGTTSPLHPGALVISVPSGAYFSTAYTNVTVTVPVLAFASSS